ncbi:MAG: response regulator transcription factor [Candidatus Cloacimonadota bacterium]|nr:response regulator transcription factor [Candidatus Cloacimonadota bacterium]
MKKKIFVVDDEIDILELISINIIKAGYDVSTFEDSHSLMKEIEKEIPDLIVLDVMLPEIDGFEVCRILRNSKKYEKIPILMLTARGDVTDKILGLEFGADDYMVKPFSPRELIARIKSILRRTNPTQLNEIKEISIRKIGQNIILNLEKFEVQKNGEILDLTSTEFKILELLSEKPGNVFSRDKLLNHLWGNEKIVIDRTIDVHIRNLRKKLGETGKLIKNVRGIGYKIIEGKI